MRRRESTENQSEAIVNDFSLSMLLYEFTICTLCIFPIFRWIIYPYPPFWFIVSLRGVSEYRLWQTESKKNEMRKMLSHAPIIIHMPIPHEYFPLFSLLQITHEHTHHACPPTARRKRNAQQLKTYFIRFSFHAQALSLDESNWLISLSVADVRNEQCSMPKLVFQRIFRRSLSLSAFASRPRPFNTNSQ